MRGSSSDFCTQGENTRRAEYGEALLHVDVIILLERQALVKGNLVIEHDNARVQISVMQRIMMDMRGHVPRGAK